jgi:MFS family permease
MPVEADSFTLASKRAALAVATFGAFMTPFDGSVVNLALPTIGREFRGDVVALGWIATSYVLGLTICVIPFGRLADIRGRRVIYVAGVALFTAASAFCGLAFSLGSLALGLLCERADRHRRHRARAHESAARRTAE